MTLLHYRYAHSRTEAATGYFSCEPDPLPGMETLLDLIASRPLDSFLRSHALRRFALLSAQDAARHFAAYFSGLSMNGGSSAAIHAFLEELAVISPSLAFLRDAYFPVPCVNSGSGSQDSTPLLLLRRSRLPDSALHVSWASFFAENIQRHRALPSAGECGLPPLFDKNGLPGGYALSLPELCREFSFSVDADDQSALSDAGLEKLAETSLRRLKESGVLAGDERRHVASLSPVALLLPWSIDTRTVNGRNAFALRGTANAYGRGFTLPRARVSCRMEMVERYSAYLSIGDNTVKDRAGPSELIQGRRSDLIRNGLNVADPNDFYLEVPYSDEPLYWIESRRVARAKSGAASEETVYVPLQSAALFSNLDEIDLCSAPGSTGLAAGLSVAQARLAALLEILERNAESTVLYRKSRCFALDSSSVGDEKLRFLLEDYASLGINVQFMDMSGQLGLPICQCFVIGPKGSIHRGHGASLSAGQALLSALTETPYPYPGGGPSGPRLRKLPTIDFAALPDYSRGSFEADLALVEALLCANGLNPVYVDLTHAGLQFPVVRALLPKAGLSADLDSFTRILPGLYKDFLLG